MAACRCTSFGGRSPDSTVPFGATVQSIPGVIAARLLAAVLMTNPSGTRTDAWPL